MLSFLPPGENARLVVDRPQVKGYIVDRRAYIELPQSHPWMKYVMNNIIDGGAFDEVPIFVHGGVTSFLSPLLPEDIKRPQSFGTDEGSFFIGWHYNHFENDQDKKLGRSKGVIYLLQDVEKELNAAADLVELAADIPASKLAKMKADRETKMRDWLDAQIPKDMPTPGPDRKDLLEMKIENDKLIYDLIGQYVQKQHLGSDAELELSDDESEIDYDDPLLYEYLEQAERDTNFFDGDLPVDDAPTPSGFSIGNFAGELAAMKAENDALLKEFFATMSSSPVPGELSPTHERRPPALMIPGEDKESSDYDSPSPARDSSQFRDDFHNFQLPPRAPELPEQEGESEEDAEGDNPLGYYPDSCPTTPIVARRPSALKRTQDAPKKASKRVSFRPEGDMIPAPIFGEPEPGPSTPLMTTHELSMWDHAHAQTHEGDDACCCVDHASEDQWWLDHDCNDPSCQHPDTPSHGEGQSVLAHAAEILVQPAH